MTNIQGDINHPTYFITLLILIYDYRIHFYRIV